jgi:mannose-6-phosphate isomerase-like protein (cupin superfamily)
MGSKLDTLIKDIKMAQDTIDRLLSKGSFGFIKKGGDVPSEKWSIEPFVEDRDCNVGFVHAPKTLLGYCEQHVHPGSREYLIVVRGSVMFNMDGRDMRVVKAGECAVVDEGHTHCSKPLEDGTKMVYVCVPLDKTVPGAHGGIFSSPFEGEQHG